MSRDLLRAAILNQHVETVAAGKLEDLHIFNPGKVSRCRAERRFGPRARAARPTTKRYNENNIPVSRCPFAKATLGRLRSITGLIIKAVLRSPGP